MLFRMGNWDSYTTMDLLRVTSQCLSEPWFFTSSLEHNVPVWASQPPEPCLRNSSSSLDPSFCSHIRITSKPTITTPSSTSCPSLKPTASPPFSAPKAHANQTPKHQNASRHHLSSPANPGSNITNIPSESAPTYCELHPASLGSLVLFSRWRGTMGLEWEGIGSVNAGKVLEIWGIDSMRCLF